MDLSVIVINYNTPQLTTDCVKSVDRYLGSELEIEVIVVDNGSESPWEPTMVPDIGTRVIYIPLDKNVGFGGANNVGVEYAESENILFMNSDAYLIDNSLLALLEYLNDEEQVSIIGPKLVHSDGRFQPSFSISFNPAISLILTPLFSRFLQLTEKRIVSYKPRQVAAVSGACMLVRRLDFIAIGGFVEDFFMYSEDTEFCLRMHRILDNKIVWHPEATVVHIGGASWNGQPAALCQQYVSRMCFARTYHGELSYYLVGVILSVLLLKKLTPNSNFTSLLQAMKSIWMLSGRLD